MGWSLGFDDNWKRWIGYGVPAVCDHPNCGKEIHRGLGYVCGGQPYGGEDGCGLFFCGKHGAGMSCSRCKEGREPFEPTPDTEEWLEHQRMDPSWAKWRAEQAQRAGGGDAL